MAEKRTESSEESVTVDKYVANLFPIHAKMRPKTNVKVEVSYTLSNQGESEFKVEVKSAAKIPVGDPVEIFVNNEKVCEVTVAETKPDFILQSNEGNEIPKIQLYDKATLAHKGEVIFNGGFSRRKEDV